MQTWEYVELHRWRANIEKTDRQTDDSLRRQYTFKWEINTWKQCFSTVFTVTRVRPSSLPWVRQIQITSSHIRFKIQINILILPRLVLPCCLFPSGFVAEIWWLFFPYPLRATNSTHTIPLQWPLHSQFIKGQIKNRRHAWFTSLHSQ
jgi:hypothetical protein